MRGITALGAAVALGASLGAGVQVTNLDPGQNARAETRGPNNPGNPTPTLERSALQRMFMGGTGGFGAPYRTTNPVRVHTLYHLAGHTEPSAEDVAAFRDLLDKAGRRIVTEGRDFDVKMHDVPGEGGR